MLCLPYQISFNPPLATDSYQTHLSKCIRAQLAGTKESTNRDACGALH